MSEIFLKNSCRSFQNGKKEVPLQVVYNYFQGPDFSGWRPCTRTHGYGRQMSHVSFFPITPCKLSSMMATFNILSLCIVTILFTPFLTRAANYKQGDKVEKSSKAFILYSNDNLKQSAHLQVPLYVNKVGPYFNPQETYHYYSLPVCRPDKVSLKYI